MRIDRIAPKPDRVGRYRVEFSDGSVMRLYRQTVEDMGLYTGMELSREMLSRLTAAAEEMSAKMRAVRIVAAGSVSKGELRHRLIQKGEDPTQAAQAAQWMEQLQLVDDEKMAQQVVARCVAKGYGLARARQTLYEKKIPKELWEDALADYPDQQDAIITFLRTRLNGDTEEKAVRRAVDALLRRGHSYGQIRKALELLALEAEDHWEE